MEISLKVRWLFRANAVINWALSLRSLVDPLGAALAFGGAVPNYPFVIRLWSAFVFMFGCMFWETGRDVRAKSALFKYNWIEKCVPAGVVTLAYLTGEAPPKLMLSVFLTNWLWIPVVFYYDRAVRRLVRGAGTAGSCAPARGAALEDRATIS